MAAERNNEFFEEVRETKRNILDMPLSEFTVSDLTALLGILGLREGVTRGFHPSHEDLQTIKNRIQNPVAEEPQAKVSQKSKRAIK